MKIFLSWSGKKSKIVAQFLKDWLKNVIQALEPWMSDEDIEKGTRWTPELAKQLEETKFGIICLTPENIHSEWIIFEAGALSKTVMETHVCPLLIDLKSSDVKGPLSQFQMTQIIKSDVFGLIKTVNKALGDSGLNEKRIEASFERWWPDFERCIASLPSDTQSIKETRSEKDMTEEMLNILRSVKGSVSSISPQIDSIYSYLGAPPNIHRRESEKRGIVYLDDILKDREKKFFSNRDKIHSVEQKKKRKKD